MRVTVKSAVVGGMLAGMLATGAAHAIEKGERIPPERTPAGAPVADTFQLDPVTARDPGGGPDWGLGTYATNKKVPCTVFGRLVDGELGMIDAAGVFHAYEVGAGPIFCHGPGKKRAGLHGDVYYDRAWLAQGDSGGCAFGVRPGARGSCPAGQVRTVRTAIVGPGVIDAAVRTSKGWKRLPVSARGALIHVDRGVFSDAATRDIRVRVRACGPAKRLDLLDFPRARRAGCTITMLLPHGKPARESARSKRNRRAKRLAIPLAVTQDDDTFVSRGYRIRFRYPITVRSLGSEGYGLKVFGPRGPRCRRGVDGTGEQLVSSYFNIEGRRGYLPLLPSRDGRRWCNGRYRVQLLFGQKRYRTTRDGQQIDTTNLKVVGQTRFQVP